MPRRVQCFSSRRNRSNAADRRDRCLHVYDRARWTSGKNFPAVVDLLFPSVGERPASTRDHRVVRSAWNTNLGEHATREISHRCHVRHRSVAHITRASDGVSQIGTEEGMSIQWLLRCTAVVGRFPRSPVAASCVLCALLAPVAVPAQSSVPASVRDTSRNTSRDTSRDTSAAHRDSVQTARRNYHRNTRRPGSTSSARGHSTREWRGTFHSTTWS